ncbi:MAG: trypsin-like serine protease [Actinomycetota bacterium]
MKGKPPVGGTSSLGLSKGVDQVYLKGIASVLIAGSVFFGASAAPAAGKKASTAPKWGPEDAPLHPGSQADTEAGQCTFNFAFYKPGSKGQAPVAYIGTAAHCTEKLGEVVRNPEVGEVGTVVYDSDLVDSGVDFALIQLNPDVVAKTNPTVLGWGGPTRSVTPEDLALGDRVDVYGYGLLLGETEQTRPRYGVLMAYTEREYQANMPAVNGDSGAPLLHHETGAALGIISRYGLAIPPTTDMGPLMPWIFEELKAAGFADVRLATVKA